MRSELRGLNSFNFTCDSDSLQYSYYSRMIEGGIRGKMYEVKPKV
jgi:hypothetical protein